MNKMTRLNRPRSHGFNIKTTIPKVVPTCLELVSTSSYLTGDTGVDYEIQFLDKLGLWFALFCALLICYFPTSSRDMQAAFLPATRDAAAARQPPAVAFIQAISAEVTKFIASIQQRQAHFEAQENVPLEKRAFVLPNTESGNRYIPLLEVFRPLCEALNPRNITKNNVDLTCVPVFQRVAANMADEHGVSFPANNRFTPANARAAADPTDPFAPIATGAEIHRLFTQARANNQSMISRLGLTDQLAGADFIMDFRRASRLSKQSRDVLALKPYLFDSHCHATTTDCLCDMVTYPIVQSTMANRGVYPPVARERVEIAMGDSVHSDSTHTSDLNMLVAIASACVNGAVPWEPIATFRPNGIKYETPNPFSTPLRGEQWQTGNQRGTFNLSCPSMPAQIPRLEGTSITIPCGTALSDDLTMRCISNVDPINGGGRNFRHTPAVGIFESAMRVTLLGANRKPVVPTGLYCDDQDRPRFTAAPLQQDPADGDGGLPNNQPIAIVGLDTRRFHTVPQDPNAGPVIPVGDDGTFFRIDEAQVEHGFLVEFGTISTLYRMCNLDTSRLPSEIQHGFRALSLWEQRNQRSNPRPPAPGNSRPTNRPSNKRTRRTVEIPNPDEEEKKNEEEKKSADQS